MIEQGVIAFTGVIAIFLSQTKSFFLRRFACLFGLAGQPFWLYVTYTADQWGIFVLSIFYTYAWALGFKNYWLDERKAKRERMLLHETE